MARNLSSQSNVDTPSSDYPSGRIRNKNNSANPPIVGTPIIEEIYGDIVEFFQKLLRLGDIAPNDIPDNETNGHQLITGLSSYVDAKDTAIANAAASDATNKANAAKNDAISAAASDATIKANTAQTNAESYSLNTVAGGKLTKVIEIGDWNMDSTDTITKTHGVNAVKIIGVSASIRVDSNIPPTNAVATMMVGADVNGLNGGQIAWTDTNIILNRTVSGRFDSTTYDETSYNRGWIIIDYLP